MMTVGQFEIFDPLFKTPTGTVWRARAIGAAGGHAGGGGVGIAAPMATHFALKQFSPSSSTGQPGAASTEDELHWENQSFVERAELQQSLAARGARHWAPIYGLGTSPAGPYAVSMEYAASVETLIVGDTPVHELGLHAIVWNIIQGLTEARQIAGRAHGNLKATNILLSDAGDVARSQVVLADPASDAVAKRMGEAGDLRALGAVIHRLVTKQLPPGFDHNAGATAAAAPSTAWKQLSRARGSRWFSLCNVLLQCDSETSRLTLADVATTVLAMSPSFPRAPQRRRRWVAGRGWAVAACVALLLVAGSVGISSWMEIEARRDVCQASDDWLGSLARGLADDARRRRLARDADLKPVIDQIVSSRIASLDCDAHRPIPLNALDVARSRASRRVVQDIRAGLAPPHWKRLSLALELSGRLRGRGWTQPADFLAARVAAVAPRRGMGLITEMESLLAVHDAIDRDLSQAEADWTRLQDGAALMDADESPLLKRFAAELRRDAAASLTLDNAALHGIDVLAAKANLATEMASASRRLGPGELDAQRFARAVAAQISTSSAGERDMRIWLKLVKLHTILRTERAGAAAVLRAHAAAAENQVRDSKPDPASLKRFDDEHKAVQQEIGAFAQLPLIASDLTDGTLARRTAEIEAQIEGMLRYRPQEKPRDWIDALPALATSSTKVNEYWSQWQIGLRDLAELMSGDRDRFVAIQGQTTALREVLIRLDQVFPRPPAAIAGKFLEVAGQRRELELEALLETIDPQTPRLTESLVKPAGEAFAAWSGDVLELSKTFPLRKELLSPDDRPEAPWVQRLVIWEDPAIQAAIRSDLQRLDSVRRLATLPRAELVRNAREAKRPELALTAWRLLGEPGVTPPWPSQAGELSVERAARVRLLALLKAVTNENERKAAIAELEAQAPPRWRRYVEGLTDEKSLAAALAAGADFGVGERVLAALSPATRFNIALHAAKEAIGAADSNDRAAGLATDLAAAAIEARDDRVPAQRTARLASFEAKERFADLNPGELFELNVAGLVEPIRFRRVQPAENARPFYLSTTEVSMEQFAAAVDGAGAWAAVAELLWRPATGERDGRAGPRVWEWVEAQSLPLPPPQPQPDAPALPHIVAPLQWMAREIENDFPEEFRAGRFNRTSLSEAVGGNPTVKHPMQHVSAEAALFVAGLTGCRLPTAGEWHAAVAAGASASTGVAGNGSSEEVKPNLRDLTWEYQRRYLVSTAGPAEQWVGGAGVFSPRHKLPAPEENRAGDGDDKTLIFRPVVGKQDDAFRDLIGNVAELVCDVPERFSDPSEKASPEGIRAFARAAAPQLAVIGGSALSPPELPLDRALPLPAVDVGWADVGFRLAFTAPSRSKLEKLKWILADQPFLWRKAEAKGRT